MGLFTQLVSIIGLAVAAPVSEITTRNTINKNVAQMEAQGAFLPYSPEAEFNSRDRVRANWDGDKSLFLKDLIPFLESDSYAYMDYSRALAKQLTINAGFKPLGVSNNVYGTSPFAYFWRTYLTDIKQFQTKSATDRIPDQE